MLPRNRVDALGAVRMEAERFDAVTRTFVVPVSRRLTLGAVIAGALSLVGLGAEAAVKSPRCPHACSSCERCQRGRCHRRNGKKRCTKGNCVDLPDDTVCDGTGHCLFGFCNPQPTCLPATQACTPSSPCCSGSCVGGACAKGTIGAPCLSANDCLSGTCLGFRCQ